MKYLLRSIFVCPLEYSRWLLGTSFGGKTGFLSGHLSGLHFCSLGTVWTTPLLDARRQLESSGHSYTSLASKFLKMTIIVIYNSITVFITGSYACYNEDMYHSTSLTPLPSSFSTVPCFNHPHTVRVFTITIS